MKLAATDLVLVLCSAILLLGQQPKKPGTAGSAPKATPTPQQGKPAQPSASPSAATPAPVSSPSAPATNAGNVPATQAAAKEPCEDVKSPAGYPLCSKTQLKEFLLSTDPDAVKLEKFGAKEAAQGKPLRFTHEAHATKNYSVDGKSVIGCAECHHTDAPKGTLKGEFTGAFSLLKVTFVTSERGAVLTTKLLSDAAAAPVKSCRACHALPGAKPVSWPKIPEVPNPDSEENGLPDPAPSNNYIAYHDNCITCHEQANRNKQVSPQRNAPTSCSNCHTGK